MNEEEFFNERAKLESQLKEVIRSQESLLGLYLESKESSVVSLTTGEVGLCPISEQQFTTSSHYSNDAWLRTVIGRHEWRVFITISSSESEGTISGYGPEWEAIKEKLIAEMELLKEAGGDEGYHRSEL